MKRLLLAAVVLVILVFGIWFIAVPESLLLNLLEHPLKDGEIRIDVISPQKGIFYSFRAERLVLKKSDKELISLDNFTGSLDLPSLFKLRVAVNLDGEIGEGKISGKTNLFGGKNHSEIHVESANIKVMPFFSLIGIEGSGLLSGELKMEEGKGETRFQIRNADFKPAVFGGIPIPLEVFHSARCAMTIAGDTVGVTSFVMEGDGIYARIKGKITGGKPDLIMELMPEKSMAEKTFIFPLLERYKVSPGYYSIPITGAVTF